MRSTPLLFTEGSFAHIKVCKPLQAIEHVQMTGDLLGACGTTFDSLSYYKRIRFS